MILSNARNGKFTASQMWKLFVGGKGVTRENYIFEKAEEIVKGHAKPEFKSKYTEHGHINEWEAADEFQRLTGFIVKSFNNEFFAINENCGSTPDGGIENMKVIITASVDYKCPVNSFFEQKMLHIKEGKPEYQNVPKESFYQAQTQMMSLTEHNKKLGHPPVTEHYLVRYLTNCYYNEDTGEKIEYDLPIETRMFWKVIKADPKVQEQILKEVEQASKERDLLVEIFKKPIL